MADVRELILVQLLAIIADIPGIETTGRNLTPQPEVKMPLIVLYDGDEEAMETAKGGMAGLVVNMLPTVVLSLGEIAENVGTVTNEWRVKILQAILSDATLRSYCDRRDGAKYLGCTTTLHQGRTDQVELVTNWQIAYPLIPSNL